MILFDLFLYEPTKGLPIDSPLSVQLRGTVEPWEVERVYKQLFDAYVKDGGKAYTNGKLKAHKETVTGWAMRCAADQRPLPVYVAASLRMLMGLDPFGLDDSAKPERKHLKPIRRLLYLEIAAYLRGESLPDRLASRLVRVDKKSIAQWRAAKWYKAALPGLLVHFIKHYGNPKRTFRFPPTSERGRYVEEARRIDGLPDDAQ